MDNLTELTQFIIPVMEETANGIWLVSYGIAGVLLFIGASSFYLVYAINNGSWKPGKHIEMSGILKPDIPLSKGRKLLFIVLMILFFSLSVSLYILAAYRMDLSFVWENAWRIFYRVVSFGFALLGIIFMIELIANRKLLNEQSSKQ